jgi:flotillin
MVGVWIAGGVIMVGVWIAIAAISILIILAFIKANLRICHPNEILVFSGKKRTLKDGTVVGYRYIKGGRGLKIPIVESVTRLPLNTIPIELELAGLPEVKTKASPMP